MTEIILASTSKYRQKLMHDAGFHVSVMRPDYEEIPVPGRHPFEQIAAFALGKAQSVSERRPDAIVIGSDQGLVDGDSLVGKPGTVDAACDQLMRLRGKTVILATSLVVIYAGKVQSHQDRAELHFRADMSDDAIRRYVEADLPLDCAGSFKIESRGSRLFESLKCSDPTAIQGLPMMKLNEMLIAALPDLDLLY